jgi:hypothetical protein
MIAWRGTTRSRRSSTRTAPCGALAAARSHAQRALRGHRVDPAGGERAEATYRLLVNGGPRPGQRAHETTLHMATFTGGAWVSVGCGIFPSSPATSCSCPWRWKSRRHHGRSTRRRRPLLETPTHKPSGWRQNTPSCAPIFSEQNGGRFFDLRSALPSSTLRSAPVSRPRPGMGKSASLAAVSGRRTPIGA